MSTEREGLTPDCDVPYQFISVPLIHHIAWARVEPFLQCDYAREEVFDPVAHSSYFLKVFSSKESVEHGV